MLGDGGLIDLGAPGPRGPLRVFVDVPELY
jgi:hypothetical protein